MIQEGPRRSLPLSFGSVAEAYDRWRPGYPREALMWIAGRITGQRAAEIGAGTGKATTELLRAGFEVVATEPDAAMAEIGRRRAPDAEWVVTAAEDWDSGDRRFDLLCGAQSWHWVPEEADARLAGLVDEGGAVAWLWNHPDLAVEEDLLGDLYGRLMPDAAESQRMALHRRDEAGWTRRLSRIAGTIETRQIDWTRVLSADDYVALTGTYSDHIALAPADLAELQRGIRERLTAVGGEIELRYTTMVYLGRIH